MAPVGGRRVTCEPGVRSVIRNYIDDESRLAALSSPTPQTLVFTALEIRQHQTDSCQRVQAGHTSIEELDLLDLFVIFSLLPWLQSYLPLLHGVSWG